MAQNLAEHHVSVTVNASIHQVYSLFTHFNDFPKFMSFVKEVTYYDDQRSHWVADMVGQHEWDAENQDWIEDRQIGWRSTNGLENTGRVTFQPVGAMQTLVDVFIAYNPPAGILGDAGEKLGVGSRFDTALQHDLDNFARMVDQAPPGALDPNSSDYLFHSGSAAAKGTTTNRQDETMGEEQNTRSAYTTVDNSSTTVGSSTDRPILDDDIINDRAGVGSSDYSRDTVDTTSTSGVRNTTSPQNADTSLRDPLASSESDRNTTY